MPFLFYLSFFARVFFQQVSPEEVNGWNKASWGMTEAQIITYVKEDLARLKKPEVYSRGIYASVCIPSFEVKNLHFKVSFQMDSATNALCGVVMKYSDANPKAAFAPIGKLLVEKYGQPISKDESDPNNPEWVWSFPKTRIVLNYYHDASIDFEVLTVHYTPTKLSPSSKF